MSNTFSLEEKFFQGELCSFCAPLVIGFQSLTLVAVQVTRTALMKKLMHVQNIFIVRWLRAQLCKAETGQHGNILYHHCHQCTHAYLYKFKCYSTYDDWKHFTPEVILHSVVKHPNEEAYRGENDFDLSLRELELFIALHYARGLYDNNHPLHFLFNETYGIPMFSETMSCGRFTANLKFLSFDDESNGRCTGNSNICSFPDIHIQSSIKILVKHFVDNG